MLRRDAGSAIEDLDDIEQPSNGQNHTLYVRRSSSAVLDTLIRVSINGEHRLQAIAPQTLTRPQQAGGQDSVAYTTTRDVRFSGAGGGVCESSIQSVAD